MQSDILFQELLSNTEAGVQVNLQVFFLVLQLITSMLI